MPATSGKADFVIQEVAGCGPFQMIISFFVYFIGKFSVVYSMSFLIFAIYNPGWRCLDVSIDEDFNFQTSTQKSIAERKHLSEGYFQNSSLSEKLHFDNCTLYYSCQNVQFDQETSTLASEWGLICDRAWIGSLIASLHMMGVLAGSLFVGHLGDAIGRKPTIYGAQVLVAVLNLASIFSSSWQMMAVFRFFIGMACCANMGLSFVYVAEFVTVKWRARVAAIPFWTVIAIICGLTLMLLKDWRHILISTTVVSVIGFMPVVWTPESLRWLEVQQRNDQFLSVARKVTRVNGKTLSLTDVVMTVQDHSHSINQTVVKKPKPNTHLVLNIFKRGYTLQTAIIALEYFSASVSYSIINFGVQALYGDFYINFIILSLCELPPHFIAVAMANALGRKICKLIWLGLTIVSFICACCFDLSSWATLKTTGIFIVVMVAKAGISGYWCFLPTQTAELYPTVVRSLALNWGGLFARVGGAIAPFIVTCASEANFISYAAMAGLIFACCLAILCLQETKGMSLRETFDDDGDFNARTAKKDGYDYL